MDADKVKIGVVLVVLLLVGNAFDVDYFALGSEGMSWGASLLSGAVILLFTMFWMG